ncbi:MAG: ABC transporter ATP-binding protein [Sutterella seckii]
MLMAAASDASSPWLDAVPREGRMDLLLQNGRSPEFPDDIDPGRLSPRPPRLEDAYALLTFRDAPGEDSEAHAASARPHESGGLSAIESMEAPKPLVIARGIRRLFGNFVAVDDTTFDVMPGEIFGILGPNGAGKTTTFRMLASLLPASEGEIEIAGANLKSAKSLARSLVGYVAQKFSLYAKLTARENLRFFGRSFGLSGKALDARIEELLHDFRLVEKADFPAGSLSLGVQKDLLDCLRLHPQPENHLSRRSDVRSRYRAAARPLAQDRAVCGKGSGRRRHDPLHGRGRILRQVSHSGRGEDHRDRESVGNPRSGLREGKG